MNTHIGTGVTALFVMLAGTVALAQLVVARPATGAPIEMTVASKRTKDLLITITSTDERLKGGENSLCVAFQRRATQEAVDVQSVSVDFTLLVGRIHEEPIKAQLTGDRAGHYCGQVNLGKQYYVPANYYAFVRYKDIAGKKKKQRLFLSVR